MESRFDPDSDSNAACSTMFNSRADWLEEPGSFNLLLLLDTFAAVIMFDSSVISIG